MGAAAPAVGVVAVDPQRRWQRTPDGDAGRRSLNMSIATILAIVALVLAVLALLGVGIANALVLAVICLALAILLPGLGVGGRRMRL